MEPPPTFILLRNVENPTNVDTPATPISSPKVANPTNSDVLLTFKLSSISTLSPTYTLPLIPAPPSTCNAPVAVLSD